MILTVLPIIISMYPFTTIYSNIERGAFIILSLMIFVISYG